MSHSFKSDRLLLENMNKCGVLSNSSEANMENDNVNNRQESSEHRVDIDQVLLESSEGETDDEILALIASSSPSESSDEDDTRSRVVESSFIDVIERYSESEFKSHFRMSKENVQHLIGEYSLSGLVPSVENGRRTRVGPQKEIYIYLWYVANTITFRQLGNLFGVARSTGWTVVRRITNWLIKIAPNFIKWPRGSVAEDTISKFQANCRIPRLIGVIDCTHVTIKAPRLNKVDYFDRNKEYSLVVQAVVDSEKRFLDDYIGEPGSLHDSRVLRRSELYRSAVSNPRHLFPGNSFLLGDSAYRSTNWIIPPFKNYGTLSTSQINFNKLHSSSRIVVENAFGLLKVRFRRLLFFTEQTDINEISKVILAICVLHNMCISLNDEFLDVVELDERNEEDNEEGMFEESTDRHQELFAYLLNNGIID